MKVSREQVRKKVVETVQSALLDGGFTVRVRWPGYGPMDVSTNKSLYVSVTLVYDDGSPVGLGPDSQMRRYGNLVIEAHYKEGEIADHKKANDIIDWLSSAVSDTDNMFPLRTYTSRPVSPPNGEQQGWMREGLVTPFWYDTSR